MRTYSSISTFIITAALVFCCAGCATVRTMPAMGRYGSPKVFSGARLDYAAATGDAAKLETFAAEAPAYPWIDLPFSVILDAFILPVTFSLEAYERVFE